MLRLELPITEENSALIDVYSRQLFKVIQQEIHDKANRQKYKVREPVVLEMDFIKWIDTVPDNIDLFYYITHCLYLHRDRGCYIIELENTTLVRGSRTLVKDLVRLLEYGNEVLPSYPLIREILSYYQANWEEEFVNVIERVLGE